MARQWRGAAAEAGLAVALSLGLIYYWFGVANRHVIFLYAHAAENLAPAQPFDPVTSSRYWMAGLVAGGALLLVMVSLHLALGRLRAWRRQPAAPAWRVWVLSALPVAVGVPAITLTVNAPTLPLGLAAAVTATTLAGLALALLPRRWAAERPGDLFWLTLDGLGLMPALLLLRAVELPGRGLSVSPALVWGVALGGLGLGALWLCLLSGLRRWRRRPTPAAPALLAAGLALSYLLMPLLHYLLGTPPGFRYITTAGNFFAAQAWLQGTALAAAAGLAWLAVALRRLKVFVVQPRA